MLYTIGRSDASFQPKLAEFHFEWQGGPDMNWTRFSTAPRSARFSAATLPPMPGTISRTTDNPTPVQGPGLMSWLGDGVTSPPTRMRGTHRAYG
jgi:hypothetical protein